MIQIDTANYIILDGKPTKFQVEQTRSRTEVWYVENQRNLGVLVKMPRARYSLSHDHPASGVAGLAQFEADFRAIISA